MNQDETLNIPPNLTPYYKLWLETKDEKGQRLGYKRFAKLIGRSPNTVKKWIRKFRALEKEKEEPHKEDEIKETLNILHKQVNYWKNKYLRLRHEKSFEVSFIEAAKEFLQAIPVFKKPEVSFSEKRGTRVKENLTLIISDIHAGEVVTKDETYGFNVYNTQTMLNRLENLFGTVIDISQNKLVGYEFERLNIDILGDMISGKIHEELVETGDLGIIESIFITAFGLAYCISVISAYFPKVVVHTVWGNHGRLTKKVRFKQGYENYDFLIYNLLQILLAKHKNVEFEIAKSWFHIYQNHNFNVCMMHGDSIRTWAGVPWYGIQRAIFKLQNMLAKKGIIIDIWELGHFHQDASLPDNVLINGSLIGPSEFSIKAMHSVAPPLQKLYGVHREIGVTFMFRVRTDKALKLKIKIPREIYNLTLDKDIISFLIDRTLAVKT